MQHTATSPLLCGAQPMRVFQDSRGRLWYVSERRAAAVTWARGTSYLLFETEDVARRVWSFPAEWTVLDGDGLEALSHGT